MNKLLSFLGIARGAGAVEPGFEAISAAVAESRAKLVIASVDLSPKTLKELKYICGKKQIPVITAGFTMLDLSRAIGIKAGSLAVCDEGFAGKILTKYTSEYKTSGNAPGNAEK